MATLAQDQLPVGRLQGRRGSLAEEMLSVLVGLAFTGALFLGLALLAGTGAPAPEPQIEDLRAVEVPPEAPPPRPTTQPAEPVEQAAGVASLDLGRSDSPVKIAVVPPDLASLFPPETDAPPAQIQPGRLYSELKPRMDVAAEFGRVYQQTEVDQRPTVVYRAAPSIPPHVRDGAKTLRVTLLLVVDQTGTATSVRILESSGNPDFDTIVSRCVKEQWSFTPAVKAGKRVRCLLQQAVRVVWKAESRFTL